MTRQEKISAINARTAAIAAAQATFTPLFAHGASDLDEADLEDRLWESTDT